MDYNDRIDELRVLLATPGLTEAEKVPLRAEHVNLRLLIGQGLNVGHEVTGPIPAPGN